MPEGAAGADAAAAVRAAVRELTTAERYRGAHVVRLRLRLRLPDLSQRRAAATPPPPAAQTACHSVREMSMASSPDDEEQKAWVHAVDRFCHACPELTDRSKKHKRECTNQC